MIYTRLGRTEIMVSRVAMGCWALAGDFNWGSQEDAESIATVHAALEAGINFFDTAEAYGAGRSEEVLGRALEGHRSDVVLATKVDDAHLSREELIRACEGSLRRLRTDYIDLYQLHWPSRTVPLAETLEALDRLQREGKIRAVGVCNFGVGDLEDLLEVGRCQTDQLPYSLLARAIEYEIQPKCLDEGIGILAYSPLMQGLLTGKFASPDEVPEGRARTRHFSRERPGTRHGEPGCEGATFAAIDEIQELCDELGVPMAQVALAWVLAQPGVTSVLAGARHPEQIVETAQAAALNLAPEVLERLTRITEEVKRALGPHPDPWEAPADSRFR
jgi:aryl-alcohol dehydrogenase-like predicted oxidoreductase